MRDTVYLIMNKSGVNGMRKTQPKLRSGEYAVRVAIEVPDEFFVRAIPTATLEVPEGYMKEPPIEVDLEEFPEEEPEDGWEGDALKESGL